MSALNARIGRSTPSPASMLIRHQIYALNDRETKRPSARLNASYVGALLVAGALVLLGCSIANTVWSTDPRPAADPSRACPHHDEQA